MNKINIFVATIIFISLTQCNFQKRQDLKVLEIPVEVYEEKVYASWLGQMVGNIYGLVHENQYLEEPGPDSFPYGYDYKPIEWLGEPPTNLLKKYEGAFSDDDTDIEYMYLLQMEKHLLGMQELLIPQVIEPQHLHQDLKQQTIQLQLELH